MTLPTNVAEMSINIEDTRLLASLKDALEKSVKANGEAVLDFSSVHRLDSSALRLLQEYAGLADEKAVKIVLRGVNTDIYKVLTLVKLTHRFLFVN